MKAGRPMAIHRKDATPMVSSMLNGASLTRLPLSWPKKAKYGILMPECSSTPAEANISISQTTTIPVDATADRIIDLVTKAEKRGIAEIEMAPTRQNSVVQGIER